jgi:hypothetical protein
VVEEEEGEQGGRGKKILGFDFNVKQEPGR